MKKPLAKILSVVCVIALVFSVCTFGVMAEESVLSALTAEKLAVSDGVNQIPSSIVSNLTLPEIDGVTWSSSNPDVLANDGTVTRPIAKDANVTLTATAGTEEKAFNFTVKARTTDVMYQDSFAYATVEDFISVGSSKPWQSYGDAVATSIGKDADGNQYAAFDFESSSALKRKAMDVQGDMIYVDFDVKADPDKDTMIQLRLAGTKVSDGSAATTTFILTRFRLGTARPYSYEIGKNFGTYTGTEFVHYHAKIDMVNKQFWVTFGDNAELGPFTVKGQRASGVNDFVAYDMNKIDLVEVKRSDSNLASGILNIDNFCISTSRSVDELIPTLSAEEQLDYVIDDLEEKFPLTDNVALSAKTVALPTYGGIVSWADENGVALGESVSLAQNQTTFNTGKLVATITPTGEGDTTPKTYTYSYTVVPAGMNVRSRNASKVAFGFDGDWEAPQVMNNTPYTEMEFKVFGKTGDPVPAGVTWTTAIESDSEVANKVAKFVNASNASKTVALTQGGGGQENMRMQMSADFKLAEGTKATIAFSGADTTAAVSFDFEAGTFALKERSNDVTQGNNPNLAETYNLADFGVEANEWNRVEIDLSTVGFVYDVYLNGTKVNDAPLNCGIVTGNGVYWANPFRYLTFELPENGAILIDNVTVAETTTKNTKAVLDGALRRINKNFTTKYAFANGETLYNDMVDTGFFPGSAYVFGNTNNSEKIPTGVSIQWKLDGVALTEVDGRVPVAFNDMGTHTLEATITYNSNTVTGSWTITGAPVALRALDTNIPGISLGNDVSGKLIVAKYTDDTMSMLESVKIYKYTNGVNETGAFDFTEDNVGNNVKMFFISEEFAPIAYSVAR